MIRSLTIGLPLGSLSQKEIEARVEHLVVTSKEIMAAVGVAPRTIRFTLPAVGVVGEVPGSLLSRLRFVDDLSSRLQVRWYCLPIDFVEEGPRRERLSGALDAISRFPRMFLNIIIADQGNISVNGASDAAGLILKVSRNSNNGFDNFRVGASCNCPPNAPFFPFSRHVGEGIAFSFALETTGMALQMTRTRANLETVRERLIESLTAVLRKVDALGTRIEEATGSAYCGLDSSFAPFPDGRTSVARLIEQILGAPVGNSGSMFVTAILTDVLRSALRASGAKSTGFNGVMFSVLEDEVLASINNLRGISLDTLIAAASVCGCGVDMVPVGGNAFQEDIAAVILDVAALSSTLAKPLGVRMLPIPGREVNEFTQFNLDFLCDSRVMAVASGERTISTAKHLFHFESPLRST